MIKHYVNITAPGKDERSIELVANPSGPMALAFWSVEPSGGDNTAVEWLPAGRRARMKAGATWVADGKFKNTLVLPHTGGDTFKVKVKGLAGGEVATGEIQTWRKIWVTVHWMNNAAKAMWSAVKPGFLDALKEGFVEVEEAGLIKTLVDEPYTPATSAALPHLYLPTPLAHKPFHLRIVIVNDIFDWKDAEYRHPNLTQRKKTFATDDPLSHLSATDWLRTAYARLHPGGGVATFGGWVDISAHVKKVDDTHWKLHLPAGSNLARAMRGPHARKLDVHVRTRERDHYNGHSLGNFVTVRTNRGGTPAENQKGIQGTFVHEAGHGLQQVVHTEQKYDGNGNPSGTDTNNLWHSNDLGGQGPHCAYNAKKVTLRAASGTTPAVQHWECEACWTSNPSAAKDLCVMLWHADPHRLVTYCPTCKPRVRRADLGESKMAAKGWNNY